MKPLDFEVLPLSVVFNTRLTKQDIEALQDRARLENNKPAVIAREAIRHYLSMEKAVS